MGILLQDFYLGIHIFHWNTAQILLEVVTAVWRSTLEVKWRSNIKIYYIALMGVLYGIFVSGNPYLALEYCSDVTGGRNCRLEVKIRGQLEVKH